VNPDASTVLSLISKFLQRLEKDHGELNGDTPLYAEGLGLDSVEAAELSAILEDEFGTDPFSDGDVPETVGDIVSFYEAAPSL
jgi:acyl carrier protein